MSFEKLEFELPPSILINGRRYFRASEIAALKTHLMSRGMNRGAPKIKGVDPAADKLIAAPVVMRDLGIARRTFYRFMKRADEKAASPKAPARKPARKAKATKAA